MSSTVSTRTTRLAKDERCRPMIPYEHLPLFLGISELEVQSVRVQVKSFPKPSIFAGAEWFFVDELDHWRFAYTRESFSKIVAEAAASSLL